MRVMGIQIYDDEIIEFLRFMCMRQSESLSKVNYKELVKIFDEDYNLIEDPARWTSEEDKEYEPSEDGSEM